MSQRNNQITPLSLELSGIFFRNLCRILIFQHSRNLRRYETGQIRKKTYHADLPSSLADNDIRLYNICKHSL